MPAWRNQLPSKRALWTTTRRPRRKSASTTSARAGTGCQRSASRRSRVRDLDGAQPVEAARQPGRFDVEREEPARAGRRASRSSGVAGEMALNLGHPSRLFSIRLWRMKNALFPQEFSPVVSLSTFGVVGWQSWVALVQLIANFRLVSEVDDSLGGPGSRLGALTARRDRALRHAVAADGFRRASVLRHFRSRGLVRCFGVPTQAPPLAS